MKLLKKDQAFTLIELLVVITIIALLVSIIMPALSKAKQQATMVVCLSNQKQLLLAWIMYADEHNDKMVRPDVNNGRNGDWVSAPANIHNCTAIQEIEGIKTGALFKYFKDPELLHCPGDKRSDKEPRWTGASGQGGWRTYSIADSLNAGNGGRDIETGYFGEKIIHNRSQIKSPQDKYVFIEDGDPRGYNEGSWVINATQTTYTSFVDNIGIFHNNKGTFGFADGHSDTHQWEDKRTLDIFKPLITVKSNSDGLNQSVSSFNPDIKWLCDHFPKIK